MSSSDPHYVSKRRTKTILIVEDDPGIRDVLELVLGYEGYFIVKAANGQEALDYLKEHEPPCIILLDLMMPLMNGWQFRGRQQSDPKLARIPTLVLSAGFQIRQHARELKVMGFVSKPIDLDTLISKIQTVCG